MKFHIQIIFFFVFILFRTVSAQNPCPSYEWIKHIGGIGNDNISKIIKDEQGNLYTTIYVPQNTYIDSTQILSEGSYLLKINNFGNLVWIKEISRLGVSDLKIGKNNNIFITGGFGGTIVVDTTTLTASFSFADIYVAKLDSLGNFIWIKQAGGVYQDVSNAIVLDEYDNVYITGFFGESAVFGNITIDSYISSFGFTAFTAKLDSVGNFIWVNKHEEEIHSFERSKGYGISIDNYGYLYSIGDILYDNTGGPKSVFLIKTDTSGNEIWVNKYGYHSSIESGSITMDGDNNLYIVGKSGDNINFYNHVTTGTGSYIAKLDTSGKSIWLSEIKKENPYSNYSIDINCIDVDKYNNVYVTGSFSGQINTGPFVLRHYYEFFNEILMGIKNDIFISKINESGDFVWTKQIGGVSGDYPSGIVSDDMGGVYLTGIFEEKSYFNGLTITDPIKNIPYISQDSLASLGGRDIFITRLRGDSSVTLDVPAMNEVFIHCGEEKELNAYPQNYINVSWSPIIDINGETTISPTVFPKETTIYTLTIKDACQNEKNETIKVNVIAPHSISAYIISDSINCGESVQIMTTVTGSHDSLFYNWEPAIYLDSIHVANPYTTPKQDITYIIKAIDSVGCIAKDTISIYLNSTLEISAPNGTLLRINEEDFFIILSATENMDHYLWSNGSEEDFIIPNVPGVYSVVAQQGECFYSDSIEITVLESVLLVDFEYILNGLEVIFMSDVSEYQDIKWDFGDGGTSDEENPNYLYSSYGSYIVTLSIVDNYGYSKKKSKEIVLSPQSMNNENKKLFDVRLYPNPSEDFFIVYSQTNEKKEIIVMDFNGRKLISKQSDQLIEKLYIEYLSSGVYYVVIEKPTGRSVHKLVKK